MKRRAADKVGRKNIKTIRSEKFGLIKNVLWILLSFIIAVALWFMGTFNDQTPVTRQLTGIPVTIVGEDVLNGKDLYLNDIGDIKVNAIIKGMSTAIFGINTDDVVAVIDVSNCVSGDLSVYPTLQNVGSDVTTTKIDSVDISIEKILTKQLDVNLEITGRPYRGYEVKHDLTEYDESIEIKCPESIADIVVGARVNVSVEGKKAMFTATADIELLDADGNVIKNDKIKLSVDNISITVYISQ